MVWKKSIFHIRRSSDHNGSTYSSTYYRRAENVFNRVQSSHDSSVQWSGANGHAVATIHGKAAGHLENGRLTSH
eukprot:3157861-Amphidinium_carterae.1